MNQHSNYKLWAKSKQRDSANALHSFSNFAFFLHIQMLVLAMKRFLWSMLSNKLFIIYLLTSLQGICISGEGKDKLWCVLNSDILWLYFVMILCDDIFWWVLNDWGCSSGHKSPWVPNKFGYLTSRETDFIVLDYIFDDLV